MPESADSSSLVNTTLDNLAAFLNTVDADSQVVGAAVEAARWADAVRGPYARLETLVSAEEPATILGQAGLRDSIAEAGIALAEALGPLMAGIE